LSARESFIIAGSSGAVTQSRIPESQESRQHDAHHVELGSNLPTRCAERPSHYRVELAQSEDSTGYNLHGSNEFKFAATRVNRPTRAARSQLESVMMRPGHDLELAEFVSKSNKSECETSRVNLPTHATRKPSRYNEFETQFCPKERARTSEPRVEL